ncbi:MFS transporter [Vibrio sp. S4M6]|uniref:MFS transporter n=1 Tax=Vibrio sinus TaxID=2946865 RepID=UPI00202AB720|nr:MFS transporter [Vibrio sinus]MCL9781632.1 MFS transporter [Vibrio sinus]
MQLRKNIIHTLKTSFGNAIEWYDFCLFGYFSATIGKLFFPTESAYSSLLIAFATFAVGFMARPLGGIIFGWVGDRVGRYFSMNLAIIIMGLSTLFIAFLPAYSSIGILAPILLVVIRIIQGISAGGQYANLLVVTAENKQLKNTGFYSGIAITVSLIGFLLASGTSYLVLNFTPPSLEHYAWRMTFFFGGVLLAIYLLIIRSQFNNSEVSFNDRSNAPNTNTYKHLWKEHKLSFMIVVLFSASLGGMFYIDFVYFVTFFNQYSHLSMSQSLTLNTISLLFACLLYPMFGLLSDKYGRAKMTLYGIVVHIVLLYPAIHLVLSQNIVSMAFGLLLLVVLGCWVQGAITPIFSEIFPRDVRSSGCCASYGIGAAISGFSPMLATQLDHSFSNGFVYIFAGALIIGAGCAILLMMRNTSNNSLIAQQS